MRTHAATLVVSAIFIFHLIHRTPPSTNISRVPTCLFITHEYTVTPMHSTVIRAMRHVYEYPSVLNARAPTISNNSNNIAYKTIKYNIQNERPSSRPYYIVKYCIRGRGMRKSVTHNVRI